MIGQNILHYRIESKLGEGGMGEVYLATDTSLDRPVALKFLSAPLQNDPEARERLIREAKSVSRLNHKNILTIHAVESVDGRDFLVMEFVEGKSLRERLDAGEDWSIEQILRIALQICDGLSAAHKQDIVHRDIKPANVLVTSDGQVKIADFGLATWRGAKQLTREGTTVGTVSYMSPEQIQGKKVDPRSDLFSLGVVLYELIARRRPFVGEHDAAISYAITNEIPEPLQRYKAGVHPGLEQLVARALEKDPATRYQTASDILAELKRVRKEIEGSQPSMLSRTMKVRPQKSYLKPLLAGSAVLVIALAIFILKPFKFDVAPEQKAAAADNSLAVVYFDNLVDAGDTDKTAQMITSLLITGLSESEYLQVTSRQRLYDIMAQLGLEDEKSIDRFSVTKVAQKAGVRWIVTGDILQLTPRIVLAAEVSEVGSGKLITTSKIQGDPGGDLFAAVDRLGNLMRDELSLQGLTKKDNVRPVADLTTHSPDAYRHYLEGVEYRRKYYSNEALGSFQKAITIDSTFAMAYYHLAMVPDARTIVGTAKVKEWVAKAERYSANSSWKDQRYIKSVVHLWNYDGAGMIRELDLLLERYPDEKEAWIDKAFYCGVEGRHEEALACNERVVALDPGYKLGYSGLAFSYEALGQFDKAIAAINQYIALAPEEANPYDSRGDLYAMNGRTQEAIESYRIAMQKNPTFNSDEKLWYMYACLGDYVRADSVCQSMVSSSIESKRIPARLFIPRLTAYQGQFRKALAQLDESISADRRDGGAEAAYVSKLMSRSGFLIAIGRREEALETAQLAVGMQKQYDTNLISAAVVLAMTYARSGQIGEADREANELRSRLLSGLDTSGWELELAACKGTVAFYAGRVDEAIQELERVDPRDRNATVVAGLAQAYLNKSQLEEAVTELERFLTFQTNYRFINPYDGVRCIYLLGLAYEQSGWKDKATEQYKKFLEIWKDADPGIPEIDDAKARLANLSS